MRRCRRARRRRRSRSRYARRGSRLRRGGTRRCIGGRCIGRHGARRRRIGIRCGRIGRNGRRRGEHLLQLARLRRLRIVGEQPRGGRLRPSLRVAVDDVRVEALQVIDSPRHLAVLGILVFPIVDGAFGKRVRGDGLLGDVVVDVVAQAGIPDRILDAEDAHFELPEVLVGRRQQAHGGEPGCLLRSRRHLMNRRFFRRSLRGPGVAGNC